MTAIFFRFLFMNSQKRLHGDLSNKPRYEYLYLYALHKMCIPQYIIYDMQQ